MKALPLRKRDVGFAGLGASLALVAALVAWALIGPTRTRDAPPDEATLAAAVRSAHEAAQEGPPTPVDNEASATAREAAEAARAALPKKAGKSSDAIEVQPPAQ